MRHSRRIAGFVEWKGPRGGVTVKPYGGATVRVAIVLEVRDASLVML